MIRLDIFPSLNIINNMGQQQKSNKDIMRNNQFRALIDIVSFHKTDDTIEQGLLSKMKKKQSQWIIILNQWADRLLVQVHKVKYWTIQKLLIDGIKENGIIKQIKQIRFQFLKHLHLNNDHIQSIEGFARIQMPALSQLFMQNNQIRQLKQLAKADCKALKVLSIRNNHILECCFINQTIWPSFENFLIQVDADSQPQITEISNLIKTRTKKINQGLWVSSKQRIIDHKLFQSLKKKQVGQLTIKTKQGQF